MVIQISTSSFVFATRSRRLATEWWYRLSKIFTPSPDRRGLLQVVPPSRSIRPLVGTVDGMSQSLYCGNLQMLRWWPGRNDCQRISCQSYDICASIALDLTIPSIVASSRSAEPAYGKLYFWPFCSWNTVPLKVLPLIHSFCEYRAARNCWYNSGLAAFSGCSPKP